MVNRVNRSKRALAHFSPKRYPTMSKLPTSLKTAFKALVVASCVMLFVFPPAFFIKSAQAGKTESLVATFEDGAFTVYPKTVCTSAKINKILKDHTSPFQLKDMIKAKVLYKGKKINACAMVRPDVGAVLVIGEDGNAGIVPMDQFAVQTGV